MTQNWGKGQKEIKVIIKEEIQKSNLQFPSYSINFTSKMPEVIPEKNQFSLLERL